MSIKQLLDAGIKIILTAGIVILFIFYLQSQNELVYVDAQKLVAGYKGMQQARKEFEGKSAIWKANLDTLRNEVEGQMKEYAMKKQKLSANERKLTEELIMTKQQQFATYQQSIQENVQREDQEMTRKVLDRVNDYLKRYGKQQGYKIILAATQYGNIVYAKDGIDITKDVLDGLNAEFN